VSNSDAFSIRISGLKTGVHIFEFDINNTFFEDFENSEIKSGNVSVEVQLDKKEKMMNLVFSLKGNVAIACDRCLDEYEQSINSISHLILKIGKFRKEETDEIEIIPESANEINVKQYIYEFIHLALPVKRIHPVNKKGESLCNKIILKKLKEHETGTKVIEDTDPRWDALKNLI
jgi:uncharacterized protein